MSKIHLSETKTRKRRTVKNGYVTLEHVAIPPGANYCDWIQLTKLKLKERERNLLNVKRKQIESVVNTNALSIPHAIANRSKFAVDADISTHTLALLYEKVDNWQGVGLSRTKASLTVYRDYFDKAKKWWDQVKSSTIGDAFWVPIFHQTQQFVYGNSAQLHILNAFFHGEIKYNNTRLQPLICGRTVMTSTKMHRYLLRVHPSLNVVRWMKEQSASTGKHSAKELMAQVRSQLDIVSNHCKLDANILAHSHQESRSNHNMNSNQRVRLNSDICQISALSTESETTNVMRIAQDAVQRDVQYGAQRGTGFTVADVRYCPVVAIRIQCQPPYRVDGRYVSNSIPNHVNVKTPDISYTIHFC